MWCDFPLMFENNEILLNCFEGIHELSFYFWKLWNLRTNCISCTIFAQFVKIGSASSLSSSTSSSSKAAPTFTWSVFSLSESHVPSWYGNSLISCLTSFLWSPQSFLVIYFTTFWNLMISMLWNLNLLILIYCY